MNPSTPHFRHSPVDEQAARPFARQPVGQLAATFLVMTPQSRVYSIIAIRRRRGAMTAFVWVDLSSRQNV
jgi:hypothetical protein